MTSWNLIKDAIIRQAMQELVQEIKDLKEIVKKLTDEQDDKKK